MDRCNASWFAVQTHGGKEYLAIANLERQGFEAWCPMIATQQRSNRKAQPPKRPMFPRYVFVKLDLSKQRWKPIDGTFGVVRLLRTGDRPAVLPRGLVSRLIELSNEDGVIELENSLQPGDQARVMSGAFDDWIGNVVEMSDQNRVVLLLQMADRAVPVTLPISRVIKVA